MNFRSNSLMSLSRDLMAFSSDIVLLWILVWSSFVLNPTSFSFYLNLTVIFASHFYTLVLSHSFLKSAVFFKLSRCFSLNLRCSLSLASESFYDNWLFVLTWRSWKSENFLSNFYWLIDFCAGCNSFNCLTKWSLSTLSYCSFVSLIFLRGLRVLVILVILVNALPPGDSVFYKFCIRNMIPFSTRTIVF